MTTAPKDKDILVLGPKGWRRAYYADCEWLRQPFEWEYDGRRYRVDGDPSVTDSWRVIADQTDIELNEARGWKPAAE